MNAGQCCRADERQDYTRAAQDKKLPCPLPLVSALAKDGHSAISQENRKQVGKVTE